MLAYDSETTRHTTKIFQIWHRQNIWEESGQVEFGVHPKGGPQDPNFVPKSECVIEETLTHSLQQ